MRDTLDEEGPRVPLKTILQNFLNHVENLEARKREGDDAYEKEFQVRLQIDFWWICEAEMELWMEFQLEFSGFESIQWWVERASRFFI